MEHLNTLLSEINRLGKEGYDLEMLPLFEKVLKLARESNDVPLLCRTLNDYGGVLRNTGRYSDAEEVLLEAKDLVKSYSGYYSAAYITTLLNLGTSYLDRKALTSAITILNEALDLSKRLGKKDILYASILNNLSVANIQMKNYFAAYEYQLDAIDILEREESSRVKLAISYSNMAEISRHLGRLEEYKHYIDIAKSLLLSSLGESHPLYSILLNNVATSLYSSGNIDEGISLLLKIIPLIERTYGNNSKIFNLANDNLKLLMTKSNNQYEQHFNNIGEELNNCSLYDENFMSNSYNSDSTFERTRLFLKDEVYPILKTEYPELLMRLCGALTGKGSECLGYDDELSKDHDYELKVQLFVTNDDYFRYEKAISERFSSILTGNVYLIPYSDFFRKYTRSSTGPKTIKEWRLIPEEFLVNATSGQIYFDNLGEFSKIRNHIKNSYPKALWLRNLSYYCIKLGQAGQYNYSRLLKRKDVVGAMLAVAETIEMIISIIYVLNKEFKPFYKWQYKRLCELPILGKVIAPKLEQVSQSNLLDFRNLDVIEETCIIILDKLLEMGLVKNRNSFFVEVGLYIFSLIEDHQLAQESPWVKGGNDEYYK